MTELSKLTAEDRAMIDAVVDGHYEVHGSAVKGDLHGSLYAAGKMAGSAKLDAKPAAVAERTIESEEFYNVCQQYRHAPMYDPEKTVTAYQELIDYIDKYCAAPAPEPVTAEGWQPIETAPKDGTPILVNLKGTSHLIVVSYDDLYINPWITLDGPCYTKNAFEKWMPLPAAPKVEDKA